MRVIDGKDTLVLDLEGACCDLQSLEACLFAQLEQRCANGEWEEAHQTIAVMQEVGII